MSRFDSMTIDEAVAALETGGSKTVKVKLDGVYDKYIPISLDIKSFVDCVDKHGNHCQPEELEDLSVPDKVLKLINDHVMFEELTVEAVEPYAHDYDKWGRTPNGTFYQGIQGMVTFDIPSRMASLEMMVHTKTISFDEVAKTKEWNVLETVQAV